MTLNDGLVAIGLNLASEAMWRVGASIAKTFKDEANPSEETLKKSIVASLNIQDADVYAEKLIQFLAKNGAISISESRIHSNTSIEMFSSPNTTLTFGNNSSSSTPNTRIDVGQGASIQASGGAGIRQNDDGSISFLA